MRAALSLFLPLAAIVAALPVLAQDKPKTVIIPQRVTQPSEVHDQAPITKWPYRTEMALPAGYRSLFLVRQFTLPRGSAELDQEAKGGLANTVREKIAGHPDWHLLIVGRPDPVESGEPDLALAGKRAETVAAYLAELGVGKKRISTLVVPDPPEDIDPEYPFSMILSGGVAIWALEKLE